jgi:predicted secreted hydrolase
MKTKPRAKVKIKKIDVFIVIVLIVIAGLVLTKAGYLSFFQEETPKNEKVVPEIPTPPLPTPPNSLIPGSMRSLSPDDEGMHFDKIRVCREWWYFTAVFNDKGSDLNSWVVTVSFNHMARGDLLGTNKPDLLVITLHGPNQEEYGGMINNERGMGLIQQPTLKAKSPGVSVTYQDSWAEGEAPSWHVHAEDNEIDIHHDLIIDLQFFAPSEPLWTMGEKLLQTQSSNLASYFFTGCNVTGTVSIDGKEYTVHGIGNYEHSWSPNIVTKGLINGWDWSHIVLENGWTLYYSNYYPTPQYLTSKTSNLNPFGTLLLSTDNGVTFTSLEDINPEITATDDRIFPFVKMPTSITITASPGLLQPFLTSSDIQLTIDLTAQNTFEKIWKFPTYVGMKVGRSVVHGTISWNDDEGYHELELYGVGSFWSMRALL